MPQRRPISSRRDEAADRTWTPRTAGSSSSNNNSQSRPGSYSEASARDRTSAAGHLGTTTAAGRGPARRSSTTTTTAPRRLGAFDSGTGASASARRRHSTEGHLTGPPSSSPAGRIGAGSIRASFHLGGGPASSSESEDVDARTHGAGGDIAGTDNDDEDDTSDGVIYGGTGRIGRGRSRPATSTSAAGAAGGHHERSSSGDDALLLEADGLDAYDSFRRAAQRDAVVAASSSSRRRTSTTMSTDDEGGLDAPDLDGSVYQEVPPRTNNAEGPGGGAGSDSRTPSSAASSSGAGSNSGDRRRIQRRKSLELLNRNEAEIMSHDFHYAEYLDMKQPSSSSTTAAGGNANTNANAGGGSRSSLHSSRNSSSLHGSVTHAAVHASSGSRRSATPISGGYSSTDDSARSYRRTTIAHSGSGGGGGDSSRKRDGDPRHSSHSSSATQSDGRHRRQSYPASHHPESDSSGLLDVHRSSSMGASAATSTACRSTSEGDSDDVDCGRGGRSAEKERKRLSDHTTVPPLELGNSCFEPPLQGGAETSSDETGAGAEYRGAGKFARRFSGHSMASINLILPQMDDSEPDVDVGDIKREISERRGRKRPSQGSKSSDQSKALSPDDLNPRWQGSMTDLTHTSTSMVYTSSSISSQRRHAAEGFHRSGNASTNFVEAADAARRWSDSDDSPPGADVKPRPVSSLSSSEGKGGKKPTRFHRGGLKGIWSIVVKNNESSRDRPKSSFFTNRNKSTERRRDVDSSENNTGSDSSRGFEGRRTKKVKRKSSADVETGRGVDVTDTGGLVGQGNLGDNMVFAGSKGNTKRPSPNKRQRIIVQCCMVIILLILAFVLPLLLKVPGLFPLRTTEALEAKARELFDRISAAASNPFLSSDEQHDILGRPLSGLSVEDPTTLFEVSIDAIRLQAPAALVNFLDVDAPAPAEASGVTVTPFLWHLDRSGSDILEDVIAVCLGQRVASDLAGNTRAQIYVAENHLRVVSVDGGSYLNVDLSTMAGVDRGRDLGLLSSGLVDSVVSPHLFYASTQLFDTAHQGRMLCMFRDPVSRELENYQNLIDSVDQDISLEEYLSEFEVQEDLVVRTITGNEYDDHPVTAEMLEQAKAIVRTKCLVGIYEQLAPSIARFEEYFGYGPVIDAPPSARPCIDKLRKEEERASRRIPKVEEGDSSYQAIMSRNQFDFELYEFAKIVWEEQGETLFERQRGGQTFRTMRLPATPSAGFRDHDVYAMNGN